MTRPGGDSHQLRAVLSADAAGFSRMLGIDEPKTIAMMHAYWRKIMPCVEKGHGETFGRAGDGFLAQFDSATDAVACGVAIQRQVMKLNRGRDDRLYFRIGVAMGEITETDSGKFGISINIATRLQALAPPGGIRVTEPVFREVSNKLPFAFDDYGPTELHNIEYPVSVFSVRWADDNLTPAPATKGRGRRAAVSRRSMLAVLPFEHFGDDDRWAGMADGMVEEIITQIARTRSITVIARSSTFTYEGRSVDVRMIGQELGVRYVLEGSIRESGERVRVTAQLVSCDNGEHIWAETFEEDSGEIFRLQDRIAVGVATSIEPRITDAEVARIRRKPPANRSAYELYLMALHFRRSHTPGDTASALALLKDAIALDPGFAPALAAAAACLLAIRDQLWGSFTPEDQSTAVAWAEAAVKAAPDDPTVLHLGGHVLACLTRPASRGLALIEQSLALNRSCSEAWARSAMAHVYVGELESAESRARTAVALSPLDSYLDIPLCALGYCALFSDRPREAIDAARRARLINPSSATAQRIILTGAHLTGDRDAMIEARDALLEISPDFTINNWMLRTPLYKPEQLSLLRDALQAAEIPL